MNTPTPTTVPLPTSVFARTRAAFQRMFAAEGSVVGATWGTVIAAFALLLTRAFPAVMGGCPRSVLLAAVPLGAGIGALLFLKRVPSISACAAITEESTHAGGLLLVAGMPGGEKWHLPEPVTPTLPSRWRRPLKGLVAAGALLVGVFLMPAEWFATVRPPEVRPLPDLTAELRNEIEDLQQTEQLDPEELAELKEELEHIAETAKANDPGTTLDAVGTVPVTVNVSS